MNNGNVPVGKLEKDTHDTLYLRPHMVTWSAPLTIDGRQESLTSAYLEKNRPSIINTMSVQNVQPIRKKDVEKFISSLGQVFDTLTSSGKKASDESC